VAAALSRVDPEIFRCIVLGGGRPPEHRPPNTVATYGLTETGSGVVYDGVPLDGVEVDIAPDGEILLRCPMMLRAYRDGTSPIDTNGWLHTDDVGTWLTDGRLHVHGRRGDLIITGGENVWPEQVEAVLAEHPLVRDVGVTGIDDVRWGQIVAAWIVPHDAAVRPSLDDLRGFVREQLPAFMAPRAVFMTMELPRTSLGKLRRRQLPSVQVIGAEAPVTTRGDTSDAT
jgi:O-succinylbenzoic acid--CoA ligase